MSADQILDQIEALLTSERAAIRQLDSAAVEECAHEKERLFAELKRALVGRSDLHARIVRVMRMARQNCLLLAYARDCVRDAMGSVARHLNTRVSERPGHSTAPPGERRSLRVSVMG